MLYTGDSTDELTVLQENYAILRHTLMDVDNLLQYFVVENIITMDEEDKIKSLDVKSEKVRNLLLYISGPLQAGDTNGFYNMLKIMKRYGTRATQSLAKHMESSLVNRTERKFLEQPEGLFLLLFTSLL